jgi:starch-binding outer membrane protein, SusD/RagB family
MRNILKFAMLLTLSMSIVSCESLVDGFDENPNDPTDAPAVTMFGGLEAANVFVHEGSYARTAGMWSGIFTGSDRQYVSTYNYSAVASDFDYGWRDIYTNGMYVARQLQEKAAAINNKSLEAAALIIEAHMIGTAADLFGDVPYSQAAQPFAYENPAYDPQLSVYAAVQATLDRAIANASESGDFAYVTSLGSWKEVAYTLKARNFLHTRQYADAIAAAQNGVSSAANDWVAKHNDIPTSYNIYYSFLDFERGGYMTADGAYGFSLLNPNSANYRGNAKTDESKRVSFYYLFDDADTYGTVDPNWKNGMFTPASTFPLVTYVENQLILAECYARTGNSAMALTHLNNARAAHAATYTTAYDAYVSADFEAGGIANVAGKTGDESLMMEILEEKYVSMYGQIEIFTDLRRTDNMLGIPANTGTRIPERFLYTQDELNSNSSVPSPIPGLFDPTPVNQ